MNYVEKRRKGDKKREFYHIGNINVYKIIKENQSIITITVIDAGTCIDTEENNN